MRGATRLFSLSVLSTRAAATLTTSVSADHAFKIPDNIPSDVAAPLLCAGATVSTPLKQESVKAGDRVGVVGIGGLGHLAIQFINALGATPVAFSRSANKEKEILALGAAEFYNLSDPEDQKKAASSVDYLVLTADANNMPYNLYLSLNIKDMLELASKENVRPIIQKLPMSKANEGLDMVREGRVRYRVVLEKLDS
ncbi:hypothetical protein BBJ28_00017068 [Nothophytophthora sp. Chile5]|nr:hypothetical protein BBJ28_00017068 [Nothophytophthora sp. Chile5]